MTRWIWLLALGSAGCPPQSNHVRVRAFVAPRAPTASFAIVYHPWSVDAAGATAARAGSEVLSPLEGFKLECTNATCQYSESSLTVKQGPADGGPIQVIVSAPGFASANIAVPDEARQHTYVVLLQRKATPEATP